ncbi:MAG: hypothetical protein Q9190_003333 [Brigantiaea leucoxantha]
MDPTKKLPVELLQIIFSLLRPQDIKTTRLVSRKWHDISSPLLITRVFFALRRKTLDVFKEIVSHPVFSQTVTELIYDFSFFDQKHDFAYCARKNLEYYRRPRRYFGTARNPTLSSRGLRYCTFHEKPAKGFQDCRRGDRTKDFEEYHQLVQEQALIRASGEDKRILSAAVRSLPKLKSLVCADWRSISGFSFDRLTGSPSYNSWYVQKGPMRWDIDGACFPLTFEAMRDEVRWPYPLIAWESLVQKVKYQTLKIQLGDDLMTYTSNQIRGMRFLPLPSALPLCVPLQTSHLAENLYHFQFEAIGGENDLGSVVPFDTRILKTFLEAASNLRSLSLQISPGPISILDVYWTSLQRLDLGGSCWVAFSMDLLEFLEKHGETLRYLRLREWDIPAGDPRSWIDVLEEIRFVLPNLKSFSFDVLRSDGLELFSPEAYEVRHTARTPDSLTFIYKIHQAIQFWVLGMSDIQRSLRYLLEDLGLRMF